MEDKLEILLTEADNAYNRQIVLESSWLCQALDGLSVDEKVEVLQSIVREEDERVFGKEDWRQDLQMSAQVA